LSIYLQSHLPSVLQLALLDLSIQIEQPPFDLPLRPSTSPSFSDPLVVWTPPLLDFSSPSACTPSAHLSPPYFFTHQYTRVTMTTSPTNFDFGHVPFLDLSYNNNESDDSARKLILTLMPDWASEDSNVEFVRFTDGITNTLLKAVNHRPGMSKLDVDRDAILLRAYGHGTAVLIDREREAENHELLMKYGLATQLLARFKNGMMYRYILGRPARAQDLSEPLILSAIARRLAHWHATVPCLSDPKHARDDKHVNGNAKSNGEAYANGDVQTSCQINGAVDGDDEKSRQQQIDSTAPGKPPPNVWTTMQKWIFALPTDTDAQRERQALLQEELKQMVKKLSQRPGLGKNGVSF
jgi:ethanolamine kinase